MKRLWLLAFVIGSIIVLPTEQAFACSCMAGTLQETVDRSAIVFRGKVISNVEASDMNRSVKFSIDAIFKGDLDNQITLVTPDNEAMCGVGFEVGKQYTVAADQREDGSYVSYLCSRMVLEGDEYVPLERAISQLEQPIDHNCDPYICRDGTTHPACTEDGHVINYFAEPCLTHGGEVGGPVSSFTDVQPGDQHYDVITWARENGVVEGYADGTFRPKANVNRAEFVKILLQANDISVEEGRTAEDCRRKPFYDVDPTAWYAKFVLQAYCMAIVRGYDDLSFRPDQPINYAEAAKIIVLTRLDEHRERTGSGAWYTPYTDYLVSLSAVPASIISYDQLLTRAEMVDILYRLSRANDLLDINEEAKRGSEMDAFGRSIWNSYIRAAEDTDVSSEYKFELRFNYKVYGDEQGSSGKGMPIRRIFLLPDPKADITSSNLEEAVSFDSVEIRGDLLRDENGTRYIRVNQMTRAYVN